MLWAEFQKKKSIFLLGNITGAKHVLHTPPSAVCLPSDKIKDWKEPSWELLCTKNWSNQKTCKETRSHPCCLHLSTNDFSFSAFILFSLPHSHIPWTAFWTRFNSLLSEDCFSPDFLFVLASLLPPGMFSSGVQCNCSLTSDKFSLAFCLLNSIHTLLFPVNTVMKHYPVILSISCSSLFTLSTAAGSIMWYK